MADAWIEFWGWWTTDRVTALGTMIVAAAAIAVGIAEWRVRSAEREDYRLRRHEEERNAQRARRSAVRQQLEMIEASYSGKNSSPGHEEHVYVVENHGDWVLTSVDLIFGFHGPQVHNVSDWADTLEYLHDLGQEEPHYDPTCSIGVHHVGSVRRGAARDVKVIGPYPPVWAALRVLDPDREPHFRSVNTDRARR